LEAAMTETSIEATPRSQQAIASPFSTAFNTIIGGYQSLGKIAENGASYSLLTAGMVTLVAAIALKFFAVAESAVAKDVPLNTGDLVVLVSGSIVLLLVGSGLRVWDRHLADKAGERDLRLRIEAAEKAAVMFTTASSPSTPPPGLTL
jgi:hypothetical protein